MRHPVAVEAGRYPVGQMDHRLGLAEKIIGVEDLQFACLMFGVDHQADQPTAIFRRIR